MNVPENMDAPCNICGRGWPYHVEACAYMQVAKENIRLKAKLAQPWLALREKCVSLLDLVPSNSKTAILLEDQISAIDDELLRLTGTQTLDRLVASTKGD